MPRVRRDCFTPEWVTPARLLLRAKRGSAPDTAVWATLQKRPVSGVCDVPLRAGDGRATAVSRLAAAVVWCGSLPRRSVRLRGLQINHPGVRAGSVRQLAGQPVHSCTRDEQVRGCRSAVEFSLSVSGWRGHDDRPPGARRCRHDLHQLAGVRSWVRWAWAQSVKLRAGRLVTVVMSPVGSELNGSRVERNCSMTACASSSGMP